MIDLINSEREILLYLATNGPAFGGQMSKSTGLSSRTVSTAPRGLEKKGLVSHSITHESRAKKEYSLTILGLCHALYFIRAEERNPIIERWADLLPLVFGKWESFVSAGFKDLVSISLSLTAYKFRKDYWSDVELSKSVSDESDESWEDMMNLMKPGEELERFQVNFYSLLFRFNVILGTPEDQKKLVDACKADPKIRDYLVDGLTKINDELRSNVDITEKVIQALHRNDKVR